MLRDAEVPAVDAAVEDLRVSVSEAPLAPVAGMPARLGGRHGPPIQVELRVLATSHQVVVEGVHPPGAPPSFTGVHVETVACGLGSGEPLRHGATYRRGIWRLTATVERVEATELAALAETWVRWGEIEPSTLTVRFAGHPHAITALALRADGWAGVHLYPGPGEGGGSVVTTRTVLDVARLAASPRRSSSSSPAGHGPGPARPGAAGGPGGPAAPGTFGHSPCRPASGASR